MKTWNRWANKPGDRPPPEPEFSDDEESDERYEEESEEEEQAPDDESEDLKKFVKIGPDDKNKTAKRVKK